MLTTRLARWGRALAAGLIGVSTVLIPTPSNAVELPPAGGYIIQTNGPNSSVNNGDWYTSTAAGAGAAYHYLTIQIPCGWPSGTPVIVDLFSPEMNRVSGALATSEEPNGNYDSTQFELYGPGASVGPGFNLPAPGAGIAGTRVTYEPGAAGVAEAWVRYATIGAPVVCGQYVLRSQVLTADPLNPGGTGDDQNGWKIRIGRDNDANPNNAPPANYDNPDGILGTNDEISVGVAQASFQQDTGAVACQTFYEYVNPAQASVTFNNFDMDGNTRLRYYAPGDASYDPNANAGGTAGTLSGNAVWNGGTLAARSGNTIAAPTSGWWRLVNCLSNHNQFIQEGQVGRSMYYAQPPTPTLTIAKSDGFANISPGQTITYTINVNNTSAGATAGAATAVVVKDTLPSQFTYQSCAIPTPAQGTWTCSQAAGVVTFTQTGWINAGAAAQLTVTATLNQGASGSKTNTASVNYTDQLSNPYPQVSATDVDTIIPRADLSITKTDSADPVSQGQAFTYTLTATNNGPADATTITVSDTVPSQFTVTGVSSAAGTCGFSGQVVTCTRPTFLSGATWTMTVSVTTGAAAAPGTYTDTATISGAESDLVPANNSGSQSTTISATADLAITKTDGVASVVAGNSTTYTITLSNNGPSTVAAGVVVSDTIPAGTTGSESEANCAIAAGVFTCTTTASIASGGSVSYQLTLAVSSGYASANLSNTAAITSSPLPDATPGNNSATDTDSVTKSANLSITKVDSADPVDPGQAFTYTLVVTDNGPSDASSLTVSDMESIESMVAASSRLLKPTGRFVFSTLHPAFNSGDVRPTVELDLDAGVTEIYSIKVSSYGRSFSSKGVAIRGQPVEQWYFHRPLWMILQPFFEHGFALDGLEEPLVDPERSDPGTPTFVYTQLPGVLVARMRRLK